MMSNTTDDVWLDKLCETKYSCIFNGESINYGDSVVAASVVVVRRNNEGLYGGLTDLSLATLPDRSDVLWDPQFFSSDGWSDVDEQLSELEDKIRVDDSHAATHCSYCASGIREGEVVVAFIRGEIHRSQRMPNGQGIGSATFCSMDPSPKLICLSCCLLMDEKVIGLWSDRVVQNDECEEGTRNRCWRHNCGATKRSCDLTRMNQHHGSWTPPLVPAHKHR